MSEVSLKPTEEPLLFLRKGIKVRIIGDIVGKGVINLGEGELLEDLTSASSEVTIPIKIGRVESSVTIPDELGRWDYIEEVLRGLYTFKKEGNEQILYSIIELEEDTIPRTISFEKV